MQANAACFGVRSLLLQETEGVPLATIREASLLKELWHPNILHLESVYVNNNSSEFALSLVFEFVDHDLHEIMQVCDPALPCTHEALL